MSKSQGQSEGSRLVTSDVLPTARISDEKDRGHGGILRLSLSQQITTKLRDEIVYGAIPPGTHLVQSQLCERFGTSRIPVRDALQQLSHEGLLVERAGQREVAEIGREELFDAQVVIVVLHAWATRRATELASDEELRELEELYNRAFEATDPLEFSEFLWLCHRKINLLAKSPRLIRTITTSQKTIPRIFPVSSGSELESAKERNRAVLDAMRARDSSEAERLMRLLSFKFLDELFVQPLVSV
ncbi:MAG TPA: GntR family transcriptional regulator [Acidimicrobiales bacterium]|nr:GntR family transcriptional regulator [Acidimicrobiales bacterium]